MFKFVNNIEAPFRLSSQKIVYILIHNIWYMFLFLFFLIVKNKFIFITWQSCLMFAYELHYLTSRTKIKAKSTKPSFKLIIRVILIYIYILSLNMIYESNNKSYFTIFFILIIYKIQHYYIFLFTKKKNVGIVHFRKWVSAWHVLMVKIHSKYF